LSSFWWNVTIADIFINDETELAASITLGERGTIQRIDLAILDDSDEDELPDDWEMAYFGDLTQHGAGDFDGDGERNLMEYENGTDPTDPMSAQRGDVDGDKYITLADAILALQIVCGVDTGTETVTVAGDVNGDGKIGIEEVIYILQKFSGLR
jgi:hypothetical protein